MTQDKVSVRRSAAPDGIVVVDKPAGWTSHDVVSKMRGLAATRKVGHAGTLDPMATGVLVVGIGKATRLLNYIVGADKDYDTTIRLGFGTTTEDAEGELLPDSVKAPNALSVSDAQAAANSLTGDIMQVPSSVSAIKIDGKRAYDRVRSGEQVEIPARPAHVAKFEVGAVSSLQTVTVSTPDPNAHEDQPSSTSAFSTQVLDCDASVTVSSGTYVRALGRDFARALGTEGHLTMLRRTRVGGYHISDAFTLDQLGQQVTENQVIEVIPLAQAAAATFPVRDLSDEETAALGFGKRLSPITQAESGADGGVVMAGISTSGELIALLKDDGKKSQPVVVFAPRQ